MPWEPAISVKKVNHYYGKGQLRKQILFEVTTDIQPGEIVIMTGPSGSGKTTLLSLIGGLRSVQEGSLKVLGQELNRSTNRLLESMRKRIGFIFQAHNLVTSLTACQNVQMSLALHDPISMQEAQQKSKEILEIVGLSPQVDYYPHQLSVGQKQRVAIARAIVSQPKIILADEPTAALDKTSGRDVVELMQHLAKKQGSTILLVTHDLRILDIADRIIHLEDGRLSSFAENFYFDIKPRITTLVQVNKDELNRSLRNLSIQQFVSFLEELKEEFQQFLQVMDILSNQDIKDNFEKVIKVLTRKIGQILQADQTTIFFVDEAKDPPLWAKITQNNSEDTLELRLTLDIGIVGYAATTGECVNVCDQYNDFGFNKETANRSGYDTHSLLCFPIFNMKNKVLAVIQLSKKTTNTPFNTKDEQQLSQLAKALGIILESWLCIIGG